MNKQRKIFGILPVTLLFCLMMICTVFALDTQALSDNAEGAVTDSAEQAELDRMRMVYEEDVRSYGGEVTDVETDRMNVGSDLFVTEDTENGAGYDIGEPNNTQESATPVTLGVTYQGELGSYTKWRLEGEDNDFFSVSLQKGGSYRITVEGYQKEFANTTCIIHMITPSNDQESIRTQMKDLGVDYYEFIAKETGKYYIRFYNYFDPDTKTEHYYSLKVSHGAAPDEDFDLGEPNNSQETATVMELGKRYRGELGSYTKYRRDGKDVDFFSVYLEKGESYRIGMTGYQTEFASTTCIIDMFAPSTKKTALSFQMRKSGADHYDYIAEEAGTYIIKIDTYFDSKTKVAHYYSLWVTKGSSEAPPEDYDAGEPNSTQAAATPVTFGNEYRGELGSYTKSVRDGEDVDFYSFGAERGTGYYINISDYVAEFASTACRTELIYPSGKVMDIGTAMREYGVNCTAFIAEETGTFYIKLYGYCDTENKKEHYYRLTVTSGPAEAPVVITENISDAKVTLDGYSYVYSGGAIEPGVVSVVLKDRTLTRDNDYTVSYSGNVNAGTGYAVITGKGNYTGTVSAAFTIGKAKNTLKVSGKTVSVKASTVKKKNRTIAANKFFKVSKKNGKVTYKKTSGNKKITVAKSGKVTIKRGIKKGTYKVKVKVTAAGDSNYKKGSKSVTIKVKIK